MGRKDGGRERRRIQMREGDLWEKERIGVEREQGKGN